MYIHRFVSKFTGKQCNSYARGTRGRERKFDRVD